MSDDFDDTSVDTGSDMGGADDFDDSSMDAGDEVVDDPGADDLADEEPDPSDEPDPGDDGGDEPDPGDDGGDEPDPGDDGGDEPDPGNDGGDEPDPGNDGGDEPDPGDDGGDEPDPGDDGGDEPDPGDDGGDEPDPGDDGGDEPDPGDDGGDEPDPGDDGGDEPDPGDDGGDEPDPGDDGGDEPDPGDDGGDEPDPGDDGGDEPDPGDDGGDEPEHSDDDRDGDLSQDVGENDTASNPNNPDEEIKDTNADALPENNGEDAIENSDSSPVPGGDNDQPNENNSPTDTINDSKPEGGKEIDADTASDPSNKDGEVTDSGANNLPEIDDSAKDGKATTEGDQSDGASSPPSPPSNPDGANDNPPPNEDAGIGDTPPNDPFRSDLPVPVNNLPTEVPEGTSPPAIKDAEVADVGASGLPADGMNISDAAPNNSDMNESEKVDPLAEQRGKLLKDHINNDVLPQANDQMKNHLHANGLDKYIPEEKLNQNLIDTTTVLTPSEMKEQYGDGWNNNIMGFNNSDHSFVDASFGSDQAKETALHEHFHQLSANDLKDENGNTLLSRRGLSIGGRDEGLNEALTQKYTVDAMKDTDPSYSNPYCAYDDAMKQINDLYNFGDNKDMFDQAYFTNNPYMLRSHFDDYCGDGFYDKMSQAFNTAIDNEYPPVVRNYALDQIGEYINDYKFSRMYRELKS